MEAYVSPALTYSARDQENVEHTGSVVQEVESTVLLTRVALVGHGSGTRSQGAGNGVAREGGNGCDDGEADHFERFQKKIV